jgi:hypothetical protein
MRASIAAAAVAAAIGLSGAPAAASRLADVEMPDRITVEGETLYLNGLGLREATALKVDVYVAGLYLTKRMYEAAEILDSQQRKRLVLHFVRDVSAADLRDAFREGFDKTGVTGIESQVDSLLGVLTDVKKGDQLVISQAPGSGAVVEIRGESVARLQSAKFERALFAIWLGDKPPNRGLKEGLLGRHDVKG